MAIACKYPENETLLVGDPVPPKARILEVCLKMIRSAVFVNWEGCNVEQDSWLIIG